MERTDPNRVRYDRTGRDPVDGPVRFSVGTTGYVLLGRVTKRETVPDVSERPENVPKKLRRKTGRKFTLKYRGTKRT